MQLAANGCVRRRNLKKITITSRLHSLRSQDADAATVKAEQKHQLQGVGAHGNLDANPHSEAEVKLTRGVSLVMDWRYMYK